MDYSDDGRHTTVSASRLRPSHYDYDDPRIEMAQVDDIHRRRLQQQVKLIATVDLFCGQKIMSNCDDQSTGITKLGFVKFF